MIKLFKSKKILENRKLSKTIFTIFYMRHFLRKRNFSLVLITGAGIIICIFNITIHFVDAFVDQVRIAAHSKLCLKGQSDNHYIT